MIILQFVSGGDLGARLIEWFGHGAAYSHVDTVMPSGALFGARSDEIGGAPPGVWHRTPDYVAGEKTLKIELPCEQKIENQYYAFLLQQRGKPYDTDAIEGFIVGRNWQKPDAWICSELVAAALVNCGWIRFPLASPANKITPPDLLLLLSALTEIHLPT